MRLKTTSALLVAGITAASADAQDVSGTITGTLALEPANWYVKSAEDENLSGWTWEGNEVNVRLVGQVRRDAPTSSRGSLTIDFRTEGNPTELEVSDFTITLTPDGAIGPGPDYTAGARNADLDVESLVVSGDEMVVAGSFSGQLVQGGAQDLVLEEDASTVTVDGNFQATIPRLESR